MNLTFDKIDRALIQIRVTITRLARLDPIPDAAKVQLQLSVEKWGWDWEWDAHCIERSVRTICGKSVDELLAARENIPFGLPVMHGEVRRYYQRFYFTELINDFRNGLKYYRHRGSLFVDCDYELLHWFERGEWQTFCRDEKERALYKKIGRIGLIFHDGRFSARVRTPELDNLLRGAFSDALAD